MTSEWRPVIGYEGFYQVSDQGEVRRIAAACGTQPGLVLVGVPTRYGYLRVALCRSGRGADIQTIHSLVLIAFVGPRPSGHVANHKNGDKADNRLINLEWVTHRENMRHAVATGLTKRKLTPQLVADIKTRKLETNASSRQLGREFGVSHVTVQFALKGWVNR